MLRFLALFAVALVLHGCTGGGNTSTGTGASDSATLDLAFLIDNAVPEDVTELRFEGTSAEGFQVFEASLAPGASRTVVVPSKLDTLEIRYLAGTEQVGIVYLQPDLQPGGTWTLTEPGVTSPLAQALRLDVLINADMWDTVPRMIAGGLGFTEIIGVPGLDVDDPVTSEQLTRAAGGTWNLVDCSLTGGTPTLDAFTSAITPQGVATTYGVPVVRGDGLPVEFSFPVRPSTIDPADFRITLTDGTQVTPEAAAIVPNFDYNERSCVVLFGQFGNRLSPDDPGALYPVRVDVVANLELVGPGGTIVSAVGMGVDSPGSPYTDPDVAPEDRGGPKLVGAKLTRMSAVGDQAPSFVANSSPNDGIALYGDEAEYRLRVFTSGGFSPDGVRGIFPTDYEQHFRVQATTAQGQTVLLEEEGVEYTVDGATVRVVGLAELSRAAEAYDSCTQEDQDNQIDIVLAGDEAAMRRITGVEVPSVDPYLPLYNPGGPGNQPTPGVRYSAPSAPHVVPVLQALDRPLTVTYIDLRRR